jgi:Holliday junction DNA helicase RuvA
VIAFLTGTVAGKGATWSLLDVHGVGFRLAMSTTSLAALSAEGDEVTVHTYLYVREDELSLYGFESLAERELFERLIGVSGVGPKVALAVLSALAPDMLKGAIAREDVTLLSSVPGVGKKTAQRMIIDLKDKLDLPDLGAGEVGGGAESGAAVEARDALLAMGFSSAEAALALRDMPAGTSAEDAVKHALRRLGGAR